MDYINAQVSKNFWYRTLSFFPQEGGNKVCVCVAIISYPEKTKVSKTLTTKITLNKKEKNSQSI